MAHRVAQCPIETRQYAIVERMADQSNRMKVVARKKRENELEHVDIEVVSRDHNEGRRETRAA